MLKKSRRVVKDSDFTRIYKSGKRASTKNLNLIFISSNQNISRFGFVVSKKQTHRIVDRNRIKRRLRACVSAKISDIKPGADVIFGGKGKVLEISSEELGEEVGKLLKIAKLLKK